MNKKLQIKHGAIQKYVTCVMPFFHPFNFVIFTLSFPLFYSLNFTKKLYNERKKNFLLIWLLQRITYIKGGRKSHL